ncbi:hypothetical protein [Sinanaerobacter chloroacetimidivorans]|jgi:hypothetical protein|nr:hypothetical protein [Sinanaerobacter chloroacetimidivorans]
MNTKFMVEETYRIPNEGERIINISKKLADIIRSDEGKRNV